MASLFQNKNPTERNLNSQRLINTTILLMMIWSGIRRNNKTVEILSTTKDLYWLNLEKVGFLLCGLAKSLESLLLM
jgi:hypothetical protein